MTHALALSKFPWAHMSDLLSYLITNEKAIISYITRSIRPSLLLISMVFHFFFVVLEQSCKILTFTLKQFLHPKQWAMGNGFLATRRCWCQETRNCTLLTRYSIIFIRKSNEIAILWVFVFFHIRTETNPSIYNKATNTLTLFLCNKNTLKNIFI